MDKFTCILLLVISCCCHGAFGKGVIVSLPGRSVQLRGEVAEFGYQFDQLGSHPANLVLAPEDDPYLCNYPSTLANAPPRAASSPIALFVSRGECSFEQKAQVALALQRNFTEDIQYVIIYNNDRNNPSQLIRMGASDLRLPTLGFLAVSTRAGSYTMSSILYYADATQRDPYLGPNETDWSYPIEIEEFRSFTRGGGGGTNTFYMLRFVLFTVLILAPCLRALYLWWNGGGRIEFRRNDRGRITGLQYVRPIPYWFAPAAQGEGSPERSQLLTEEQVRDLPEITYVKLPGDDDDEDSTDGTSSESCGIVPESDQEQQEEPTIIVGSIDMNDENNHDDDVEKGQEEPWHNDESSQSSPVAVQPPVGPLPQEPPDSGLTTSCTTCSICIDDFEDGERVRVLPKCKHAFHTDCLMPWLTERQGCCPLCKRSVLGPDNDSDDEENEGNRLHAEQGVELTQVQQSADQGQAGEDNNEVQGQAAPIDGAAQHETATSQVLEAEIHVPATSRTEDRPGVSPV